MAKKQPLFHSEVLGEFAAHLIGRWFVICEEATKEDLYHECHNFWFGIIGLNKVSIATNNARDRDGAVHFSIAMGNEMRRVAQYIEDKIGVNPLIDDSGEWRTS